MGIIKATAEMGPRPGNIPIKVPEKQPKTTINKLNGMSAVDNPVNTPSNMCFSYQKNNRAGAI
jgi:hypothetical protein